MRVEWTNYAIERRDQIANYIRGRFGAKHKDKFMQEVRKTTKTLKSSPNLGSVDPLFRDRSATYRSIIINGLSKLVYRIDDDVIHIVAFWDTRSEPEVQAAQVE